MGRRGGNGAVGDGDGGAMDDPGERGGVRAWLGVPLSGRALRNGLVLYGPTHWGAAVRDRDGHIQVASGRVPELLPRLARIPGLGGLLMLVEYELVIPMVRRRLPVAGFPFGDPRTIAGLGLSLLGSILSSALGKRVRSSTVRSGLEMLSASPAVAAALLMDRDLAAYHGAEHKVIGAYKEGIGDAAEAPKEQDGCGGNLVAPMLLLSVTGTLLLERAVKKPSQWAYSAVALGGVAAALELHGWSERNHGTPLAEMYYTPGREIQRRFTTKEPTPEQLHVATMALIETLGAEGAIVEDEPPTSS